jgi:hypothetical protein
MRKHDLRAGERRTSRWVLWLLLPLLVLGVVALMLSMDDSCLMMWGAF